MILACTSSTLASSYVYILGDSGFGACIRKCLKQWLTRCFNSEPYGCICNFNTTLFPSHSFQKCSLITTNTDWISTDYRSAESQAMSFVRYTFNLKQYHIFRWVFLQLNVITSTKVLANEMRIGWNVQDLIISLRVGTGPFPFLASHWLKCGHGWANLDNADEGKSPGAGEQKNGRSLDLWLSASLIPGLNCLSPIC